MASVTATGGGCSRRVQLRASGPKQTGIFSCKGFRLCISTEERIEQDKRRFELLRTTLAKEEEERKTAEARRLASKRGPGRPPKVRQLVDLTLEDVPEEPPKKKAKAPGAKRQYTN
jgi:hypothetical protein